MKGSILALTLFLPMLFMLNGCKGNGGSSPVITQEDPGIVVFSRQTSAQQDLYAIRSDGTGIVSLATSTDNERYVSKTSDDRIVFSRWSDGTQSDLYIVNSDGTNLISLVSTTLNEEFKKMTSNDRIIYTRYTGTFQDIYIVNPDGTGTMPLAATADDESFIETTSDNRIIFERLIGLHRDLYIINPDGSNLVSLATTSRNEEFVGITSDGRILYDSYLFPNRDLYIVNSDGSGRRLLIPESSSNVYYFYNGSTPDGRLLINRWDSSVNKQALYSIRDDGAELTSLYSNSSTNTIGVLKTTGDNRVLFMHSEWPASGNLSIVRSDGSGLISLATSTGIQAYAGVTGDERVVFLRKISGLTDLYSVKLDGTALTKIGPNLVEADSLQVVLTADDKVVSFSEPTPGEYTLNIVNADGSGQSVLHTTPALADIYQAGSGHVFLNTYDGLQYDLSLIRINGAALTSLATSSDDEFPVVYIEGSI